jgi:hypothetical protein
MKLQIFKYIFSLISLSIALTFAIYSQSNYDNSYLQKYKLSYSKAEKNMGMQDAKRVSVLARKALDIYLWSKEYYENKNYYAAKQLLDLLWQEHPAGTDKWNGSYYDAKIMNIGSPSVYYALRMLTVANDYRIKMSMTNQGSPVKINARLTVVLPGKTRGLQPRNMNELSRNTGVMVTNHLQTQLLQNNFATVKQMAWLFMEYVTAITDGKMRAQVEVLHLPDLTLPVGTWQSSYGGQKLYYASLKDDWLNKMWQAIPENVKNKTDWWWLIQPSHFPEKVPKLNQIGFICGGMGGVPGGAPLFISDDLTHVRQRPFQGGKTLRSFEHKTYFPQWFQHEFFHHIFQKYPEFKLEVNGHDWFNRNFWPKDFQGKFEADYFHEALFKRIIPRGRIPLSQQLRYAPLFDTSRLKNLKRQDIEGIYERRPVQNSWHKGSIRFLRNENGRMVFQWTNAANSKWTLYYNKEKMRLDTGTDNPYYDINKATGRAFLLKMSKTSSSGIIGGFSFQNEDYIKVR